MQSHRPAYAALGITVLWTLACCPIPISREVTVLPTTTLTVMDSKGNLAEGATVIVRRITAGPSPYYEADRWTQRTDAQGQIRYTFQRGTEMSMPLMMHGVEFYAWEACAVKGAQGGAVIRWSGERRDDGEVIDTIWDGELKLDPAIKQCTWENLPKRGEPEG